MPLYTLKETCVFSCEYETEEQVPKKQESLVATAIGEVVAYETRYGKAEFSIHCDPSSTRNQGNDAYFKCVDKINFKDADRIARIYFSKAAYDTRHSNRYHMKTDKLNRKEKEILMNFLTSPISEEFKLKATHPELRKHINTGWEYLIYTFNIAYNIPEAQMIHEILTGEKINRNMLSIKMPMPNYARL